MVTPTLIRFSVAQEEQTNRVIRQYSSCVPNFIRLSFVTEDLDKGFYFGGQSVNYMLGYIHGIITHGFKLGDLHFQFLGYSNSQLKSHSCWFLCSNNSKAQISAEEVDRFMGNFDKEKNVLKKYARKGQCFSTSTFVKIMRPD
jgi:RNA-dependent RNA polymerase